MFKIADLKILTKILALLGLMGLLTLSSTLYSAQQMHHIDNGYNGLLDGQSKATMALARAGRFAVMVDRSLYRLATSTTVEGNNEALKELAESREKYEGYMEKARQALPAKAGEIAALSDKFHAALDQSCKETIRLGSSTEATENAKALKSLNDVCDPAIFDLLKVSKVVVDEMTTETDRVSDALTVDTNSAITSTTVFILFALVLAFVAATVLTRRFIVRPIAEITHGLNELANDNLL